MRKVLVMAVVWALPMASQAADLLQVYREALVNDAPFASARAQLAATRERIPQGRAGLLPTIGLAGNINHNEIESATGKRNYGSDGYSLNLSQPLFRMQNWVSYDQSKLLVTQAEAVFAQARQDLILRVTQAYFDVLLAQDTLEVLEAQKKAVSEQLEQAKRSFEVGTTTITDTHEAQARYDLVVALAIAAGNDLEVKRQALRQLTGKEPEVLLRLKRGVEIRRPAPDDINQWSASAETSAYAVVAQQAGVEIAALEIDKSRAGHYPTVDLVASYGRSHSGSTLTVGSTVTSTVIGVQLAVPLYAGGAVTSRERETAALREKSLQDLETARRAAALAARQAYLGVTSGLAQVRALEQALVSSQSALDSNKLGYEVGVRINIDVLNAQQQVFATRRDLAKSKYDTLLAQLRLRAAAAGLSEDDLQAVNALLGN